MDFTLTEQQEMIRRSVRQFADSELVQVIDICDKENQFPHEIRPKLAALNLYGITFPSEYGGAGADHVSLAIVMEELAKVLPTMGIHVQLANLIADEFFRLGSEEQKQAWMIPIVSGEKVGCFAFTEPETGSNPKMIKTTAKSDRDGYIINGTKRWITHAPFADVALIFAKDDSGDISLFFVETDRPGWSTGKVFDLMGVRGDMVSEVYLENIRIPRTNLLGASGGKFDELKRIMGFGKLCLSAQCIGIMQAALDEAIRYAQNRINDGKPITSFQSIRWLIAEMASRLEACRWLVYHSAWLQDQGLEIDSIIKSGSMCKLFVGREAVDVVRMGVQAHGVYGFSKDHKIERLYRDVKLYELTEGTSELQRELVAGRILKEYN